MPDNSFSGLPPNINERKKPEAVGVRILGELDPRTMTQEMFEKSPGLLFHGSRKLVNFSSDLDYQSKEYLADSDGSMTLGFGFYTTDDINEASNYSIVRQGRQVELPSIVTPILPYQARVLDIRNKNNLSNNVPVTKEFIRKWAEKFWKYLETRAPREDNLGGIILSALEADYAKLLEEALELEEIDLRELLGTAYSTKIKNSMELPAPPWTLLFPNFMREEGYDGLIYNEGGEGQKAKGGASYVFYNLKKVGTYESWQKSK